MEGGTQTLFPNPNSTSPKVYMLYPTCLLNRTALRRLLFCGFPVVVALCLCVTCICQLILGTCTGVATCCTIWKALSLTTPTPTPLSLRYSSLLIVCDVVVVQFFRMLHTPESMHPQSRYPEGNMTSVVGAGLDELMRHVPALRPQCIKALVSSLKEVR